MRLYPSLPLARIWAQPHGRWHATIAALDPLRAQVGQRTSRFRAAGAGSLALVLLLTSSPVQAFRGGQEPTPAQLTTTTPQAPAEQASTIPPSGPAPSPALHRPPSPRKPTPKFDTTEPTADPRPPVGMLITGLTTFVLGYTACTVSGLQALQRSKRSPRRRPDAYADYIPAIERKFATRMLVPVIGPLAAPQFGRDIGASIFAVFAGATQLAGLSLALLGSIKYSNAKREHEARAARRKLSIFAAPGGAGLQGQF